MIVCQTLLQQCREPGPKPFPSQDSRREPGAGQSEEGEGKSNDLIPAKGSWHLGWKARLGVGAAVATA